jgi:hypothetical protein
MFNGLFGFPSVENIKVEIKRGIEYHIILNLPVMKTHNL